MASSLPPKSSPFTKKTEKSGNLRRLFAEGKCRWGKTCKHVRDERPRSPPPGMKKRLSGERNSRHEKRRSIDTTETRSAQRDTASVVLNRWLETYPLSNLYKPTSWYRQWGVIHTKQGLDTSAIRIAGCVSYVRTPYSPTVGDEEYGLYSR